MATLYFCILLTIGQLEVRPVPGLRKIPDFQSSGIICLATLLRRRSPSPEYTTTPLKKYVVFNASENGVYAYPLEKFVFDLNIQFSRG